MYSTLAIPAYPSSDQDRNFHQPTVSTLVELLSHRAQYQFSQKAYTFLQNDERELASLTYQELDTQARVIAAKLQSVASPGERALLLYPSGIEFISAFLGCLYAGIIAVPLYPPRRNQNLARLQAVVTDAQAKLALTAQLTLDNLEKWLTDSPELVALNWVATDKPLETAPHEWYFPKVTADSLAFLQYTSGSTGTPKGVKVTHGNLLHNCQLIYQKFGHSPNSRGLVWLPLYHDMGLIGGVLQPLYGGFPVTLMSPVDFLQKPYRWLQAISRHRITSSGGPNFAYDLCCQKVSDEQLATLDLSCWEVAFTGAEPVRAETLDKFAEKFAPCGFRREAFYPCYGMAEATLLITGGDSTQAPVLQTVDEDALAENRLVAVAAGQARSRTLVGCGRAGLGQQIAIVDPQRRLECQAGQVGEIWVSGQSVAQGYWNQPDKSREIFGADLANSQAGPFLRTGDLGFVREDGELFVTGRLKDVMIIRGRNHYPQDIELTVEQSHRVLRPGCSAAFTVKLSGNEQLVIVQEVERTYLRKVDLNEVAGSIRQAIATQHGLQVYAVVLLKTGSIPKTSSGKIQRYLCQQKFEAGTLEALNWQGDSLSLRSVSLPSPLAEMSLAKNSPPFLVQIPLQMEAERQC